MNAPAFCELSGGCKSDDRIWGIYNPQTNKLHRLTFSRSLAELIAKKTGLSIGRWNYHIGEAIQPDQDSPSGLYALLDAKSGLALRISLDKRIAAVHCDESSRKLACAYIS